jgi:hypothetical protein
LSYEEKLQIKCLGAHRPLHNKSEIGNGKFNNEWFGKNLWLSVANQSLFFLPRLLFGGEGVWSKSGFKDLKHLYERVSFPSLKGYKHSYATPWDKKSDHAVNPARRPHPENDRL